MESEREARIDTSDREARIGAEDKGQRAEVKIQELETRLRQLRGG